MWFRILKPTGFASIAGSVMVFLMRRTLATGLRNWVQTRCMVLWPHEFWAGLWNFHPGAFVKFILGGDPANVRRFWERMPSKPGMEERERWQDQAVPLALHGDGVAVSNIRGVASKTADTLSWSSLLTTGLTRMTHYFIWFTFGHLVKDSGLGQTWRTFWRKLTESFRALASGRWPEHSMDGTPNERAGEYLAGGFWGLIYVNRGDLDWMHKHFGLASVAAIRPCALCRCTNTGDDHIPWTDVNNPPGVGGALLVRRGAFMGCLRGFRTGEQLRRLQQNFIHVTAVTA